ncbi:molybdopterin-binding protein [Kocuria tytonis]|uniref:molybdopterin-binding protein n=1 Tax=Kocuria tytonis TaxID=2054280 RepID=UPI001F34E31A|nr:molybdopterin-binding protein [Kocuria tytonis]
MSRPAAPSWAHTFPTLRHPARDAARRRAHETGAALAGARRGGTREDVSLERAPGRVAAADVRAAVPVPHYASSAMDGYAVSGRGPWTIVSSSAGSGHTGPGTAPSRTAGPGPAHEPAGATPPPVLPSAASAIVLAPGTAVPVVTGGVIPGGATTVVREEFALRRGDRLDLDPAAPRTELAGRHIRPAGTECAAHELLFRAGSVLSPADAAFAAVAGLDVLPVRAVPRVALLLTGSEVITSGLPAPGFVRDAFSMSLPAMLAAYGARVDGVQRVPDEPGALAAAFEAACADHDLVVTTGGTSRSRADLVRPLVERECHLLVEQLDLQPGHPTLLGAAPHAAVLALPGNPLGAVVGLLLLGGALLAGFSGRAPVPFEPVTSGAAVAGGRAERLVPARRRDGTWVPCRSVGSNMLRGLAAADAVLAVPRGGLEPGDPTVVLPLPW